MKILPVLGKNPSRKEQENFKKLSYYKKKSFINLDSRVLLIRRKSLIKSLLTLLFPHYKQSRVRIPSLKTNLKELKCQDVSVVWLGHSSLFLKSKFLTILIDPVLSTFASPFPGSIRAFKGTLIYNAADFPEIDYLVITHDHYDHLDYKTVYALKSRIKKVIVPLGVGSHFRYWGYKEEQIIELGWFDKYILNTKDYIIATPTLHLSGRTLRMRKTLWASYVLNIDDKKIFLGGDGGYGKYFKIIGEKYGPFDIAFLENGQYNVNWPHNHMFPEQTLQAAFDLNAKMIFPIHWGKFSLSDHDWNRPIQKLLKIADEKNFLVTVPKIGEIYIIGMEVKREIWWC